MLAIRFHRISLRALALVAVGLLGVAGSSGAWAAKCKALKSGTSRVIVPQDPDPDWRHYLLQFDAKTLKYTDWDGGQGKLTPQVEPCAYTTPDGNPLVVSKSSLWMLRTLDSNTGQGHLVMVLPEMAVPLKTMAGTWNAIGADKRADGLFHTNNTQYVISKTGVVSTYDCGDGGMGTCGKLTPKGTLTPDVAGGYDLTWSDGRPSDRVFAYSDKNGAVIVLVHLDSLYVLARQAMRTLPAVGDRTAQWGVTQSVTGSSSAMTFEHREVLSIDIAEQSYHRRTDESCVEQTLFINKNRPGLSFRDTGTATNCAGQTVSVSAVQAFGTGLGMSVYGWESADTGKPRFFGMSIDQP